MNLGALLQKEFLTMLLVIDIGNTNSVIGVYDGRRLVRTGGYERKDVQQKMSLTSLPPIFFPKVISVPKESAKRLSPAWSPLW
jgi:molecular chaperone DnaK (HSP70)